MSHPLAEYNRTLSERYQKTARQQAPSGEWYLSPKTFRVLVNVSYSTLLDNWRAHGIPILDYEALDSYPFRNASGRMVDYYSESQGQRIIAARKASASATPTDDIVAEKASASATPTDDIVAETVAAKRCMVSVNRVRRLAHARAIESERRYIYKAEGRQTTEIYFVSVSSLRRHLHDVAANKQRPKSIADPFSVKEAAQECGVQPATINCWINAKKIRHENPGHVGRGGRRFVVSRSEVLEFAATQKRTLSSGDKEEWLYLFQVAIQFPQLSEKTLWYYSKHKHRGIIGYNVPPLGRPVTTRTVDRPPGLRCPYKRVSQFFAADVRALVKWLAARANGSAPSLLDGAEPAVAETAPASGAARAAATTLPRWDEMTATLFWGEGSIRQFRSNPAKNQRDLIEAFHRENWPRTIPDPFLRCAKTKRNHLPVEPKSGAEYYPIPGRWNWRGGELGTSLLATKNISKVLL